MPRNIQPERKLIFQDRDPRPVTSSPLNYAAERPDSQRRALEINSFTDGESISLVL